MLMNHITKVGLVTRKHGEWKNREGNIIEDLRESD
jgi:hypothetical protein